ncbi:MULTISPECIES: hypothetical protein [Catenibacterium]|uniref:hypothetical protein n=1 Tax=Catenibacterium TaxID=135858 RepID=UPI001C2165D4|nr:hypothetical protein [Catenibacterium mitsuokai]MBU9057204.1 hypothetical protein [Catenibacterium mitsuokai]MCB5427874.1 hypothetical protein [Catenibacterium mitsuokai]
MNPLFKLIKKQDTISLIILILLIPIVTRLSKRVNFIYILFTSNYITLILNIACLVLIYKKIMIINGINHTLITRMGYKNTQQTTYSFMIIITLSFLIILYGFLFLIYGISHMNIKLLLMLVIYTFLYLFEISIIYLQFNRKSNILYIALPIIINLAYHYMFF